jgi:lysophospholipase L1-like esterase
MAFNNTFDLIGDSHLHRLLEADVRLPIAGSVTCWTKRGGGLLFLEQTVHSILQRGVADVTLVFLGGNDIDSHSLDLDSLTDRFVTALQALEDAGSLVVMMDQWPRPGARVGSYWYEQSEKYFKQIMEEKLAGRAWIWLWEWDRSVRFNETFFHFDGVHCATYMHKKVARYLCAAAIAAARRLNLGHTC